MPYRFHFSGMMPFKVSGAIEDKHSVTENSFSSKVKGVFDMVAKWSHFMIGSTVLVLGVFGAACGPTTIDQGSAGNGGTAGNGGMGGTGGSSTSSSSGGGGGGVVACDPMNLPAEGTPCQTEGEYCSPGCEDPCSFCNIVNCTNGKWAHLEVFPAQCLSCDDLCVPVVAAQCAGGPPDQMACVQGCNQNQMGTCKIAFNQMLACVSPSPMFTCDAMNRPTRAGCETQFDKLYTCITP